jgi:hypothetical protein
VALTFETAISLETASRVQATISASLWWMRLDPMATPGRASSPNLSARARRREARRLLTFLGSSSATTCSR